MEQDRSEGTLWHQGAHSSTSRVPGKGSTQAGAEESQALSNRWAQPHLGQQGKVGWVPHLTRWDLSPPLSFQLLDLKIFVDTDSDIRLVRRLRRDISERGRDIEGVIKQYNKFVKPAFDQYIQPTMRLADIVVPRGTCPRLSSDTPETPQRPQPSPLSSGVCGFLNPHPTCNPNLRQSRKSHMDLRLVPSRQV